MNFLTGAYAYIRMIVLGAKNHIRSLPGLLAGALAAPLIIAAAFAAAGPVIYGAFNQPKLDLIFCDLEGSSYFDTLINLLLADESITKTVGVKKLGYDQAISALESGEADAVIVFPETFISDMSRGINRPVKIIASERDPVRAVFIKEFMKSAADELSAAQSAINTVWFHMDLQNMSDARRNFAFTSLTLEYTSKAFARSAYYTFQNVDAVYEGGSPAAFIITSALATIIFFGSLSGVKQIQAERRFGVTARLAATGVGGVKVAFYHFAPIFIKQLLCALFAVLIALPAVAVSERAVSVSASASVTEAAAAAAAAKNADRIIGGVVGEALEDAYGPASDAPEDPADRSPGQGAIYTGQPEEQPLAPASADDAGRTGFPEIVGMTFSKTTAARLSRVFPLLCVLCFFTASLTLFCGYMFRRSEPAEALIVTVGAIMAITGGTVIPYLYMPDAFQLFGGFSFNKLAQGAIASALFGARADAAPLLPVAAASALLSAASVWKNMRERV